MNENETHIVKSLKGGCKEAYAKIYRSYFYRVYAFLNKTIKDDYLSKEISQEVFFRLWVNHTKLDVSIPIGSYLYTIAKNIVADHFKHKNVERRYAEKYLDEFGNCSNEEFHNTFDEIKEIVERAITLMPPQQAHVFRLSRFHGMLNEQIAKELNISKRTVEKHISNSIKTMRKALKHVLMFFITV